MNMNMYKLLLFSSKVGWITYGLSQNYDMLDRIGFKLLLNGWEKFKITEATENNIEAIKEGIFKYNADDNVYYHFIFN